MSRAVEPPYHLSDLIVASTLVFTGKAFIKRLVINVAGATSPRIRVYDALTATGTPIYDFNPPAIGGPVLEVICNTGIYVELNGTTPPQLYVAYKKMQ